MKHVNVSKYFKPVKFLTYLKLYFIHIDISLQIRKYFLSVHKFMELYKSGETGNTVFDLMAKQRKKHRGGAEFGPIDHSKKSYERDRNFCL